MIRGGEEETIKVSSPQPFIKYFIKHRTLYKWVSFVSEARVGLLGSASLLWNSYMKDGPCRRLSRNLRQVVRENHDWQGPVNFDLIGKPTNEDGPRVIEALLRFLQDRIKKEVQEGDTYGECVRLAFHDAGSRDKWRGTGGANACIAIPCPEGVTCEYNYEGHRGLRPIIDALNALYMQGGWSYTLSRADWFHCASFLAFRLSASMTYGSVPFRWGRIDCPHNLPYFGNMPDAEMMDFNYYYSFFDAMGLSPQEMVVLLGAHSLGRMDANNLGYDGPWTTKKAVFNNEYYQVLLNTNYNWNRQTVATLRWNYRHFFKSGAGSPVAGLGMLNADIMLFWDISDQVCEVGLSAFSASRQARSPQCAKNEWFPLLETYGRDNSLFVADFERAFLKLGELGLGQAYGVGIRGAFRNDYDGYGGQGQGDLNSWAARGGGYGLVPMQWPRSYTPSASASGATTMTSSNSWGSGGASWGR
eukprot:g23166.t1